jgi:predicted GNAT family acetyltransferase
VWNINIIVLQIGLKGDDIMVEILISSAMVHNNNSIEVLNTLSGCRNRGYWKTGTLDLCEKLLGEGITQIANITDGNSPAIKLFRNHGIKKSNTAYGVNISNA